jgi:DNA-binding NtrC family response regulator
MAFHGSIEHSPQSSRVVPGSHEHNGSVKEQSPDLLVMMVTAYGDEDRRRVAQECGAAEFITKPVDFDFLKRQL